MGFIDWHKNKKDHYEDVLDYAKERREEEARRQKDKQIRCWMGELLSDPRYANVKSSDAIKLLVKEYISLKKEYAAFMNSCYPLENGIDNNLLWEDLWTATTEQILTIPNLSEQQELTLLRTMQDKVFKLHTCLPAEQHKQERQTNRKYKRYLDNCFTVGADLPMLFWRYMHHIQRHSGQAVAKMIAGFIRCRLVLAYYLYLTGEPGELWIEQMETDIEILTSLQHQIERGIYEEPDYKKLRNPLFISREATFEKLSKMVKVLLFNFRAKAKNKEGGIKMIEELYTALDDGVITFEKITSILPAGVKEQIIQRTLPSFPKPELQVLNSEERLYYLDHAVLYQGREQDDEVLFRTYKGTVYFTDQGLIFQGDGQVSIRYESIERIVEYDLLPELLEVISNGKSNFIQLPDVESAYLVLKLISNRNRGESVDEAKMPFTYEELVDKADLGACIFAFEYVLSGDIPDAMRVQLTALISRLKCLQRTVVQYPDKKNSIYQFLHYYVPNAVKVVAEYQKYQFVVDDRALQNVYEKVTAAVRTLDLAVLQKIADLYDLATMDTIAQADALRDILSQDGYVDAAYAIK